jgi:hypothetical protein
MTDRPKHLSDTVRALLTAAAMRDDHFIHPPQLPIAATRQVARSLLASGLAEAAPTSDEAADFGWPVGDGGRTLLLRATAVGLARIAEGADTTAASVANETMAEAARLLTRTGSDAGNEASAPAPTTGLSPASPCCAPQNAQVVPDEPNGRSMAASTTTAAAKPTTRAARWARRDDGLQPAAQALLDAWDKHGDTRGGGFEQLTDTIAGLRATLAAGAATSRPIDCASTRPETKRAQVLAMLGRNEGASGPQIAEATGWAAHTVRGFLAGLARRGIAVKVLERVRQVGPGKTGATGSYTVYRVGDGRS